MFISEEKGGGGGGSAREIFIPQAAVKRLALARGLASLGPYQPRDDANFFGVPTR